MNFKTSAMKFVRPKVMFPILAFIVLLYGYGDRYETIQPSGAPVSKPVALEIPGVNLDETRALYNLVVKKELGDKFGLVEMRSEGILIHPGETKPTKVSFKLSHSYHKLSVKPFIAILPADAATIKEAGTVGVEFIIDGKYEERYFVNRDTVLIKEFDLINVDTLTVVVDNGDGKPWFDWLMLGVVGMK